MNRSVDPGVDFFEYANGAWLKRNPIPASESSWGIGNVVQEQLYLNLRQINEQAASNTNPAGSDQQKIGDFWATAMDTAKAERLGVHPLDAELARIDAIGSASDALDAAFAMQPLGIGAFIGVYVGQDEKASSEMAIHLYQSGLGLPDRDYYVNPDTGVARTRDEYIGHLARTLELLGRDTTAARSAAANVMAFETALARASRKLEDLRDPQANYNRMTPAEVTSKHTPSIDWSARLGAWNLRPEFVIVGQPEFLSAMDSLVGRTPVPVLQDYLRLRLVSSYSEYLSKAFDDEHFRFYSQALSGQEEQRLRWKRVLDAQGDAMGMVVGRLFVKEYFPPAAKKRYADMVEAIRAAYRERITKIDWMSDATKAKALQKLAAIIPKVGYPDKWKDYSALVIGRQSYAGNMMNAARWQFNDMISKYGKPVDRTEWHMTPQTYNAYYSDSNNEIVLPAAVFTIPGVTDDRIDDAVAYGYTGAATIGHEITHGFDDEGRQFDAAGNLADWWTKEDAERFRQRAEVMVRQFDGYEPVPGLHINGKASLGENIADYGGLLLGLDAFRHTEQYRQGRKIGGLTPMQRYFMGYALGWLSRQRDAALRMQLLSNVHAPAKWRVLGPMANIPEFYAAFGVKPGQPMWRAEADRVRIW
jgi:putative endopeptidase